MKTTDLLPFTKGGKFLVRCKETGRTFYINIWNMEESEITGIIEYEDVWCEEGGLGPLFHNQCDGQFELTQLPDEYNHYENNRL